MGQQIKKVIKRRRRKDYLRRKNEQAKLGGSVKKASVVKKAPADASGEKPAKKAAKKAATKKAPAKKAAKSVEDVSVEETPAAEESSES